MDKSFTVAGVSTLDGQIKLRFANDLAIRVKVLARNGHDAIRLVELPQEMDKAAAARFLSQHDQFADLAAQAAIASFLSKSAPKLAKAPAKAVKAKAKAKVTVAEMA